MIVVDTSALAAILFAEAEAPACRRRIAASDRRLISAVTLMEALVVAERRAFGPEMERLVIGFDIEVSAVTEASARGAAEAYARWGKGVHPARLNLVDCFSYQLALSRAAPLLYVGGDFARTDVRSALSDVSDG